MQHTNAIFCTLYYTGFKRNTHIQGFAHHFIFTVGVSCGHHRANTCGACTQGNGASWCNGECSWCEATKTCISQDDTCNGT